MQYMGSKNKLAKELIPIIESYFNENTKGYLEPFVGGANLIAKVNHSNKIGSDINKYLIALLKYVSEGNELPLTISEEEYLKVKNNKDSYPDWYVGLVGFCGSFGAKFFGGFAKGNDNRDRPKEAINNLLEQREKIKGIKFINKSFLELPKEKIKNYVIYCDIPYKDTTTYKTNQFPYEEFYGWCIEMSKNNIVLISEYNMPEDKFECIWSKEHYTSLGSGINKDMDNKKIEKLYKVRWRNVQQRRDV